MKTSKKLIAPIALATLAITGSNQSWAQFDNTLMPAVPAFRTAVIGNPPNIKMATEFPKVDAEMPVYLVRSAGRADESIKKLSEAFALSGEMVSNGRGKWALRDKGGTKEQQTLTLFEESGGFFYRYDKQLHAIPEKQPELPKRDEARRIAVNYLASRGLLPKDALTGRSDVDYAQPRLVEFDGKTGKTLNSMLTGIEVRFRQNWDGYDVSGPGSKLYVAIGEGGRVVGVTSMWRQADRSQTYLRTVSPERALAGLNRGNGHLATPAGCDVAEVSRFSVAYWSESPKSAQRTSIPVYTIEGTCVDAKGEKLGEFEGYLPAVYNGDLNLNADKPNRDDTQDDDV